MRRAPVLAALLCGVLAPAAHAGTPFTIGEGQDPHHIVDAGGTAHVVWNNDASQIFYCQVPRGATACASGPTVIDVGLEYGADGTFLVAGGGGTLHWVMPHYVNGRTYVWTSSDNGATWGPRTQVYDFGGGTDHTEPFLGPQSGQVTFAAWNLNPQVWAASLDGSESAVTARSTHTGGGGYDMAVGPAPDGAIVAVTNDLANASFFRMEPGRDPSDQSAWGGASPVGAGKDTRVAGGPGGLYLLSSVPHPDGGHHQEVRRWTGAGFSPPHVFDEAGFINDVHVGPSGAVAAIWRRNDSPNRLRMVTSTDGGATYAMSTIAIDDVVMDSMDVALAPDGQGWASYKGGSGSTGARVQIRVVETTPVAEAGAGVPAGSGTDGTVSPNPPSIRRRTANVGGAELRLDVPGTCIPRSAPRFRARLSVRRFPRRGTFVNVRRVDFLVGARRVRRDRRAPFVQTITIRNPVAGRTYTLRTRAFIERKRKRRLQRRAIGARVTVCGG